MNEVIFTAFFAVIGGMAASIPFILYEHRKMKESFDQLLQELDRAASGQIQETAYDESMNAAIIERLNRIVRTCGMQRDKAKEERDVVKSLISNISHQVRTPLSNIMLYTDLLKEQGLEKEALLLIDKVQKHSEKLDFFMKELIKSSYAEQEMITVHPEMTDIQEIIYRASQNVELAALKKNIAIKLDILSENCYADRKWTIEALGNVLENAVKYSPADSMVEVKTLLYESFLCIQVKDEGIGIREEERGKVFERFYRGPSVQAEPGFGIGLYLAREILSKQRGYIKIKSQDGPGTTIQIYLSRFEI